MGVPVPALMFWIGCLFGTFITLVSVIIIIIAAVLYVCWTRKKYQKQSKSDPEDEDWENNFTKVDLDKQPLLDHH